MCLDRVDSVHARIPVRVRSREQRFRPEYEIILNLVAQELLLNAKHGHIWGNTSGSLIDVQLCELNDSDIYPFTSISDRDPLLTTDSADTWVASEPKFFNTDMWEKITDPPPLKYSTLSRWLVWGTNRMHVSLSHLAIPFRITDTHLPGIFDQFMWMDCGYHQRAWTSMAQWHSAIGIDLR